MPHSPVRSSSARRHRSTPRPAPARAAPQSAPRRADPPNAHPPRCRRAAAAPPRCARPPRSSHQAARGSVDEVDESADLGPLRGERGETLERVRQLQIRAIEDAVGLADVADLLFAEAAPLEALGVDAVRHGGVPRHHHVRGHVAREDRAAAEEGMCADLGELVYGGEAAEDHPVADLDVTAHGDAVGEHGVVADHAVVRDVGERHEQVVAANGGDALVVGGAAVDGAALAEDVAVADDQPGRLAAVFLVLGRIADGSELEDAVVRADRGRAVHDHVWPDDGARTDLHLWANDAEGTDRHIRREPRLGGDDGARVDHLPVSGATIMSAWATSASPTSATVAKRQMPLSDRSSCALSSNWSPGTTGRRKRALSMPTR